MFVLSCFAAHAADEGIVVKEATGEAAIVKDNEEKAFDDAKAQALRSAVEQAAGVYVSGDTVTKNNQLVMDRVLSNTTGFVRKFDVVSKKKEKGVLSVTLKVEVGTKELEKDIIATRGIVDRLFSRKVLVAVQEQSIDDKGTATRSEVLPTAITNSLRNEGWRIIDEKGTVADAAMKVSSGVAHGALDAKEIGRKSDVDFIIYGSVNIRYIPPSTGPLPEVDKDGKQLLFFVTGDYDLSMFETRTGRQLGKVVGRLTAPLPKMSTMAVTSYNQTALSLCSLESPRIVNEIRAPVMEYLRDQDVNGAAVVLKVSGLADFDQMDDFGKALEMVKGVKQVRPGEFAEGKGEFEVSFLGNSSEFGRALKGTMFKTKKISVTTVRNNSVEVAVGK
jgi:hypothetical protein